MTAPKPAPPRAVVPRADVVSVRFRGTNPASYVAFVTVGAAPEVRVSFDPSVSRSRPWKCGQHGRQAEPDCMHTDLADAAATARAENTREETA